MSDPASRPSAQVGRRPVALPEGVSAAEWALERTRVQNPRIRTYLGCLRLVEEVSDSNFAILHSSPERFAKIRRRLLRILDLIRDDLAPLLSESSKLPRLEEARAAAEHAYDAYRRTVLAEAGRLRQAPAARSATDLRADLCVALGKTHTFLVDTFGQLMAGDPRSQHDADYFLSRRFRRDIEEAEWLYATVDRLGSFVKDLGYQRSRSFQALAATLRRVPVLPEGRAWRQVRELIELLREELNPKLKEVLALRAIRYSELELLERHTTRIPAHCEALLQVHDLGAEVERRLEAEGNGPAAGSDPVSTVVWPVLTGRMATLLEELDRALEDLSAFVPLWLENISMRRALMLRKLPEPGA